MTRTIPSAEERLVRLLQLIALELKQCRTCGVELYIVRHYSGRVVTYEKSGFSHSSSSPHCEVTDENNFR
jgi:hypothetical protein